VHDVAAHHGTEQHAKEGEKGGGFTCRFFPSSLSSPVRSRFEDDANTKMRDNSEKKCASSLLKHLHESDKRAGYRRCNCSPAVSATILQMQDRCKMIYIGTSRSSICFVTIKHRGSSLEKLLRR
jgi:hypothetical protein